MSAPRAAYLSLGANLGDRAAALREAVRRLDAADGLALSAVSSLYETAPWGKTDQPPFLNIAAAFCTTLAPEALLDAAQTVETALGRVRHERWGARTIDIDLLYVEGETRDTPRLTLPHPYMLARAFVLVPLAEIAGGLVAAGRTIRAWRDEAGTAGVALSGAFWESEAAGKSGAI